MLEKRRFHRVRFTAACQLTHNGISYMGQVENISLNGALVSFNEGLIVPQDDECLLRVHLAGEGAPLELAAKIIYSNFTMVGAQFISVSAAAMERLHELVASLSKDPAKLSDELKLLEKDSGGGNR